MSFSFVDRFFLWKGAYMIIKRVLTNNAAVIQEKGKEKIVCGKGLAFKKKPGMEIDESLINQVFVLEEKNTTFMVELNKYLEWFKNKRIKKRLNYLSPKELNLSYQQI